MGNQGPQAGSFWSQERCSRGIRTGTCWPYRAGGQRLCPTKGLNAPLATDLTTSRRESPTDLLCLHSPAFRAQTCESESGISAIQLHTGRTPLILGIPIRTNHIAKVPPPQGKWDFCYLHGSVSKRRGWDSNPRKVALQTISSRSLSTTQPPLQGPTGPKAL